MSESIPSDPIAQYVLAQEKLSNFIESFEHDSIDITRRYAFFRRVFSILRLPAPTPFILAKQKALDEFESFKEEFPKETWFFLDLSKHFIAGFLSFLFPLSLLCEINNIEYYYKDTKDYLKKQNAKALHWFILTAISFLICFIVTTILFLSLFSLADFIYKNNITSLTQNPNNNQIDGLSAISIILISIIIYFVFFTIISYRLAFFITDRMYAETICIRESLYILTDLSKEDILLDLTRRDVLIYRIKMVV